MRLTAANQITLLRIILIIPFVLCMVEANHSSFYRYVALSIFVVMAVSDAVDGYLARVKKQATRLGAFLDPMADKLLITCACILLASQRFAVPGFQLPLEVVILILGKDALLCLGFMTLYILTGDVRIALVWVGKLATFLQLVMVASILIAPEMVRWLPGWAVWVPICWWSAGCVAIAAVTIYIYGGLRYINQLEQQQNRQEDAEKGQTGKK
jgi:CDP-diacylglycerol--glycerol-3-phosphate 3-phosphatidyltransferase